MPWLEPSSVLLIRIVAAGIQLKNFVDGTGWYSLGESDNGGRSDECKGHLQDGDTYKVAFNDDGDEPGYDKT